jgi:hypothetical protein
MQTEEIVRESLVKLYSTDGVLFDRNDGRGVCERRLVFRYAYHLQNMLPEFFVDCDFNSSFDIIKRDDGTIECRDRKGKIIRNLDGTETKRFIDIIVHRRDFETQENDFICFEIKKWNNDSKKKREKDYNNLRVLTTTYGYELGFFLVLGKTKETTKWTIFDDGRIVTNYEPVFHVK